MKVCAINNFSIALGERGGNCCEVDFDAKEVWNAVKTNDNRMKMKRGGITLYLPAFKFDTKFKVVG